MVGREPNLNPIVDDWEKEWREFFDELAAGPSSPLMTTHDHDTPQHDVKEEVEEDEEDYFNGILASPLIQVFSVLISTDFEDANPCEIYGSIRASEGPSPRFHLYDRDPEDSETILKDGTLSLIGPQYAPLVPFFSTTLDLCLKDRIRGVDVVNGQLCLEPATEDSFDKLLKGSVRGPHGIAYVYYAVFRFAVYGIVELIINNKNIDDKAYNAVDIYGSLVARYENAPSYCSVDEETKWAETHLFDKPSHRPLRVLSRTSISLSREVVVMPVNSILDIELELWDSHGKIGIDRLQFEAGCSFALGRPTYPTEYGSFNVFVIWKNPLCHLIGDRKREENQRATSGNMDVVLKTEEGQKKPRVLHDQHSSPSSVVPRPIPAKLVNRGEFKAEVFTVCVGGNNEKISTLSGTILIKDGGDIFSIYNREDSDYELLPDNCLATIEVNYRPIQNCDFCIFLDLRDPIGKLQVSKGSIRVNFTNIMSANVDNTRLCSVVRGKDGYAAVNYAVFNNGFEAYLDVKVFANADSDTRINLYGSLIARYGGHDYSTSYREKYFTSKLFDCPRDKMVEVKHGFGLPMVKSIVVLPPWSCLVIEAKLWASGISNVDDLADGIAEFEIDLCAPEPKEIKGKDFSIEISVQFKEYE